MNRLSWFRGIVAVIAFSSGRIALQASAAEASALQIPAENVAYYDAATQQMQVQLVKPSGVGNDPLEGTKVTVVGSTGLVASAVADDTGTGTVKVNGPGWYSVVVSNRDGHAAVPFVAREMRPDTLPNPTVDANALKVPMMVLPNAEALRINRSYLPMKRREANAPLVESTATDGIAGGSHYRFQLGADGVVTGQLATVSPNGFVQAGAGNNVLIYSEGVLVSRTTSDDVGKFSVNNLSPGVYGMVAVGPAGYAAFAFEAEDQSAVARSGSTTEGKTFVSTSTLDRKLVNLMQDPVPPVTIPMIPPSMVPPFPVVPPSDDDDDDAGAFIPPGQSPPGFVGPGGGGFGVGGGGLGGGLGAGAGGIAGGGGGLLGLAAVGGIAAAAIAAGTDNNNNNVIPQVNTNGQQ